MCKIWFLHSKHSRIWFLDTDIQLTFPAMKQAALTCWRPFHKSSMISANSFSKMTERSAKLDFFLHLQFGCTINNYSRYRHKFWFSEKLPNLFKGMKFVKFMNKTVRFIGFIYELHTNLMYVKPINFIVFTYKSQDFGKFL